MKVLQISTPFLPVTPDLKYGGSERIVYLLDLELHKQGLSAGVVAPHGSRPSSKLHPTLKQGMGVDDVLDRTKSSWEGYSNRAEHAALAVKYANDLPGVDLVHLHDDNILPFDFMIKKPTLITLHSDIDGFWNLTDNPFISQRKARFVSISQSQKRIYESRGHRVDYVVYNGIDEENFSRPSNKQSYLLSLGGINPMKGQKDAIEVGRRTGLDLIIAGNIGDAKYFEEEVKPHVTHDLTTETNKLAAYASLNSNSPKVVYVGPVNDRQKAPLFSSAKAFLMPIHWDEPFGLVLVESMMSGTPVIAYNRGSIPEVVAEGTGIIVPADSLEEMVKAVEGIEGLDFSNCRNIAIQKFGKQRMVENYIEVYSDILSQFY